MSTQPQQMVLQSKRKWFWIGIVMGLNPVTGLVYGIGLLFESSYRKEAVIIIVWTIVWAIASYLLSYWLTVSGYLPRFQVIP